MKNSMREISELEVMQVSGGDLGGAVVGLEYLPSQFANTATSYVNATALFANTLILIGAYAVQIAAVSSTTP